MRNTIFAFLLVLLLTTSLIPQKAEAAQKAADISAILATSTTVQAVQDSRVKALQAYLTQKGSPLADYAGVFVAEADKNGIDWRLVAAISGVESGFGRAYPAGSYNGWGWGIYGNNSHAFTSWNDAIVTISKGLKTNYINRGATDIYSIGHIYAADPNWAYKVQRYINEIDVFQTVYQNKSLPISL
jgi:hypothetical protein